MRTPEYRLPYEDQLTEEAWSIASSRAFYEAQGVKWEPWRLKVHTVNVVDVISGKKPELEVIVPDEQDYYWAKQKVDSNIKRSNYYLERLQRAKVIYSAFVDEHEYLHTTNPWSTSLYSSWNGRRNGLTVDHFFFLTGIPDEKLRLVFHYDPESLTPPVVFLNGFSDFTEGGQKKLTEIVDKPIAFVHYWASNANHGRFFHSWNLSTKEILYP